MYRFVFENPHRFPLVNDGYDVLKHESLIKELLDNIAKKEMYLEVNPHLAEGKRDISYTYPEQTITEWALEKNILFSYGSDAHNPTSVGVYLDELERCSVYGKALKQWENKK